MQKLRIVIAQLNFLVGDIEGNLNKIADSIKTAKQQLNGDLVIFPELALTGYPPEDLLLRNDFHARVKKALEELTKNTHDIDVIIGIPERIDDKIYNAAVVIRDGKIIGNYHKQFLPNYGVFDEKRYFTPGDSPTPCIVNFQGIPTSILICEDLWFPKPMAEAKNAGAKLIIVINASPFDIHKLKDREKMLTQRIAETQLPIVYAHLIGGQDELVFDGRSMVYSKEAKLMHLAPLFEEILLPVDIEFDQEVKIVSSEIKSPLNREAKVYKALVTGLRDYVHKNHFSGALLGLSGGIDSALTLTIAVDALGKENVHAVLLPSRYTSVMSIEDSKELAKNLGVKYSLISIEPAFEAFLEGLKNEFAKVSPDVTEENIQARCRAIFLMAMSNKFGKLLLSTGNKSELAVGYATLYGDMAGAFGVLKDVYKTLVYELANYRNNIESVIPLRIITRPPSAELRHGQTDQDILPPYAILDQILERYVEYNESVQNIVHAGFAEEIVRQVIHMVDKNEYKRRQAPPGVKITSRAFGRDRRYPITSGFKPE
jgi:NAD+ synthase (glutamine-hydrolysing)